MNTLVCSCGSFVELPLAFRSLSGDNLALASHPRMGQRHMHAHMWTNTGCLRKTFSMLAGDKSSDPH